MLQRLTSDRPLPAAVHGRGAATRVVMLMLQAQGTCYDKNLVLKDTGFKLCPFKKTDGMPTIPSLADRCQMLSAFTVQPP